MMHKKKLHKYSYNSCAFNNLEGNQELRHQKNNTTKKNNNQTALYQKGQYGIQTIPNHNTNLAQFIVKQTKLRYGANVILIASP